MIPWEVREIQWCLLCTQREENGMGADLCAHCQAEVSDLTEALIAPQEGEQP